MKTSVVGLGKLGAPLAAVLASKGHSVIGVDINEEFVRKINAGEAPVFEPRLAEMIQENRERLSATADCRRAVLESDVTFIIVATPSDETRRFSLRYVFPVAETIGKAIAEKSSYHLVVLTSTVMPGSCDKEVVPVLEEASGKQCGVDFGLCYNPEFIALGSVVRDMLNPDFVLIGESDSKAGEILESIYDNLYEQNKSRPPVCRMNFINAELSKLSVNTFVTTKISYANMLAGICEKLPGADADVVTSAIGCDSRIGKKYLKGGLPYGGPCFPRDNVAFATFARELGAAANVAEATDEINRLRNIGIEEMISSRLSNGGRVGILGLSYKANTDVVEVSPGIALAKRLIENGRPVVVYDPAAMNNARRELGDSVEYASSAAECAGQASVLVVAVNWDEFRKLSANDLLQNGERPTIIDCWRALQSDDFTHAAEFLSLGMGPVAPALSEAVPEEVH